MLSRDHHDGRIRESRAHAVQLVEQVQNRRIGRANGVEDVARQQDQVRPLDQEIVDRPAEGLRDVRLALIAAPGRLPVILAEAQVEVGEVGEFQRGHFPPVSWSENWRDRVVTCGAPPGPRSSTRMLPPIVERSGMPFASEYARSPVSAPDTRTVWSSATPRFVSLTETGSPGNVLSTATTTVVSGPAA